MARLGVYETVMRAAHASLLALGLLFASSCAAPSGLASREIAQPALPSAERASVASAQPVPASRELTPETPGLYGNVIELPSGSAFVLSASPGEGVRAREPRTGIVGSLAMSEAEVDMESLPTEQRLEAHEVDLYEGSELVCRVRLGRLLLAKQAEWEGFDAAMLGADAPPDGKEPAPEVMARGALGSAAEWLVASLPDDPSCARAEWGRLASLPPPVFAVPLPEPDVRVPLARFEADEIWSQHQKSYEVHEQAATRWGATPTGGRWADDASAKLRARMLRFAGQELVLVSIEAGEPCSFQAAVSGLFVARSGGLETLWIQDGAEIEGLLVDLDGDGELERVDRRGAWALRGGEWSWTLTQPARYGCSC